MSNSSDKDKADRGNDTPPDAPYEVRNKKPPRSSSPVFLAIRRAARKEASIFARGFGRGLRKSIVVTKNGRPTRMPVLDVIANRLLESSMKGDLKAIQRVDQSDQEATANEMAKHGEAEDIASRIRRLCASLVRGRHPRSALRAPHPFPRFGE